MKKVAVLAITKNGIEMSLKLKQSFSDFEIFAPIKFSDDNKKFIGIKKQVARKLLIYSKIMMQ